MQGASGLYVTISLDDADFADAVKRLVEDEELRRKMSVEARRTVEDRDWSAAFAMFWAMSPE